MHVRVLHQFQRVVSVVTVRREGGELSEMKMCRQSTQGRTKVKVLLVKAERL